MNRTILTLLVLSWIQLFPSSAGSTFYPKSGEEDVTILSDRFPTFSGGAFLGAGDFNGDGKDDVAVDVARTVSKSEISLFFGGFSGKTISSADEVMRIFSNYQKDTPHSLVFADLDNDGKKDLVIGIHSPTENSRGEIHIIRGSTAPLAEVDLTTSHEGLVINGKLNSLLGYSMTAGYFNEDDREDLLVGAPGVSECYLFFGGLTPLAGTINLDDSHPLAVIRTTTGVFGAHVTKGRFNGDNWDDLVLSALTANVGGRTGNSEIHVLFGGKEFPSSWILGSPAADVRVWGASGNQQHVGTAAGDLTGDGLDELLIQAFDGFGGTNITNLLVAGSDIAVGGILDLSPTSEHAVPTYPISTVGFAGSRMSKFGDFDGDGISDLFLLAPNLRAMAILSTDFGPGGVDLNSLTASSLVWNGVFLDLALADLNGDAVKDLLVFDKLESILYVPTFGVTRGIYGFEPLRNPSVRIVSRSPPSPRLKLNLAVGGDPVEMKLSGNVADAFRDQWIPYRTDLDVTLTSEEGNKTVRVVFRNRLGRESDAAEDSLILTPGDPGVLTGTNRLRPGGKAAFDCHVTESTRLRVRVFDGHGEEVLSLFDQTFDPGIVPVVWDGADSNGGRVNAGVYFLVMELNGERITKKVLVE